MTTTKETRLNASNYKKLTEGERYQVRVGLGGVVLDALFVGASARDGVPVLKFQDEDGTEWTARLRKDHFVTRDMIDGRDGAPVSVFGF